MNKLDGKLIVDRETLAAIITIVTSCNADYAALGNMRGMTYTMDAIQLMEEALAQDNTGWVATVAKPSESMLVESAGELPEYRPDDPEWDQLEYEIVSAERHMSAAIYRTMLEASPPLPGGGE
jgi:hypothetical protein